jgi:hypothetical protein
MLLTIVASDECISISVSKLAINIFLGSLQSNIHVTINGLQFTSMSDQHKHFVILRKNRPL